MRTICSSVGVSMLKAIASPSCRPLHSRINVLAKNNSAHSGRQDTIRPEPPHLKHFPVPPQLEHFPLPLHRSHGKLPIFPVPSQAAHLPVP
jgi:hypothetical protein